MKRITLIALATAGLSFAATPSYAQSSYGGNTGDSYGNSVDREAAKAERAAKKAAKKAEKARIKAAEMKADAMVEKDYSSATDTKAMQDYSSATDAKMMKDHPSATDASMMKMPGTMMTKENTIMINSESMLPTNCPSGTVPQTDGTCMLN